MVAALVAALSMLGGADPCAAPVPVGPRGLPAGLAIHTTCGGYVLRPDGRVDRARFPSDWPSWAPPGSARIARGTYMTRRGGYITVLREGRTFWRSSRPYKYTEAIVGGRRAIAFTVYNGPGYIARYGRRERAVLRGEQPIGFTRAGLLITGVWERGASGHTLRLRRLDGSLVSLVARAVRGYTFDQNSRILFYVSRARALARYDGERNVVLAPLKWRSSSMWPSLLEGRLLAVSSDGRLDVFRRDGSWFASANWRSRAGKTGLTSLDAAAVGSPQGDAVGLILRRRPSLRATRERALVAYLRAGMRTPIVVHERRIPLSCGGVGGLAWRGDWLLFTAYNQRVVAIDTANRRTIDLTTLMRRLPGREAGTTKVAFWTRWL